MDAELRRIAQTTGRARRRTHWKYAVATILLTGLAQAGQIYKSVGPDGKVTYSDRPPPTSQSTDITQNLHEQDPGLKSEPVTAALNVYTKEIIVETVARFCMTFVPQSATQVKAARDAWMLRHAILRQKKIVVLHDKFSEAELAALAARVEQENDNVLRTIRQASIQERQKMCTEAPQKFTASEFDLASKRDLVDVLVNYKVKPKT